ncbi:putative NBD/HSP70 family sugar kinase [Rhizobium lentis]|uniref:Putative NBD/HSP70 family sugar kinase n=2 Tax=Rhizobium lentis TaxID=1138194 RepID=A0A7W8XGS7_9HYPH|nr:putative NBD/HSP70 family sugar kinase [Rhizobium lentis]MBB5552057.1 putative NBD/HSP70 family sugar kinase [Rhizobium lentis]MBB5562595.1 putative NBD/HSP70 family sugar kinase [Rhizobium lentis]MBB5569858.1 putative NBD/HSP70 family sugar kinase [Rhizobium lentis]
MRFVWPLVQALTPQKGTLMAKSSSKHGDEVNALLAHGATVLPLVTVDDYNNELRDKNGFIGDNANKKTFQQKLDDWRKRIRKVGDDPIGKTATTKLSKKKIDALLKGDDMEAAALVMGAVEDFAQDFADVIGKFLKDKRWVKTERIVVGGGFRHSRFGELTIARTMVILKAAGIDVEIVPIVHHPDEAGLIGSVHLMPRWMFKGHEAILAVDIGGTNVRAGVVKFGKDDVPNFADASVWESTIWRHADDEPSRTATIERLTAMLQELIGKAEKASLKPAPIIGIACPGIIKADGSIERGGQNLPGGNWESDSFNLPAALMKAIPEIGDDSTFVMMHNDAVVQGLSQIPFMTDVSRWAVLTIGTGLGNAHFTNREGMKAR